MGLFRWDVGRSQELEELLPPPGRDQSLPSSHLFPGAFQSFLLLGQTRLLPWVPGREAVTWNIHDDGKGMELGVPGPRALPGNLPLEQHLERSRLL